ncbi:ABC-type cobalt transport system, ATPase component [Agrilactobacillus composti DSM 18527 = JCM 14202]|uniref:ABC-type cobalt transport system, ATPase component n=2 Tax=Agrilactobacillus TaxID=2767875 RepID=A0A0R1XZJ6_9LACO|nr:ABC transporter ATP-binding protein [Agrilactobacillus composti]KRM35550.1 ABC-type cobalt transport system, ATPase component [Agrilactobacillus composti DSM 18527 = JCM 14202]
MMSKELSAKNLTFSYEADSPKILDNVNLIIQANTFNILYGPSGSGKSTLMKVLYGLYPEFAGTIQSGQVLIDAQDLADLKPGAIVKKIAFLFQNPLNQFAMTTVDLEFKFTLENLALPKADMAQRIKTALAQLHITDLRYRKIDTLSGGELQRVALAITLAMDSQFIILDEPFASVDLTSRQQLLALLKDLQVNHGKTILLADHDLSGYADLVDHLYQFDQGKVQEIADFSVVFAKFQHFDQQRRFPLPISADDCVLNFKDLSYGTGESPLVQNANLPLLQGKMVLLTGANGSGKSTLFKTLTRLHPFSGTIYYQQEEIRKIRPKQYAQKVALIFQNAQMQYLRLTLQEELDLSLAHAHHPEIWTPAVISDQLQALHLKGLEDHIVYQLSGGQQKKLQILEMLIVGTPVLLLDEPLAGLDMASIQVVLPMIATMAAKQQQTIIMISHQLTGVLNFFDYHLALADKTLSYQEVLAYQSIN